MKRWSPDETALMLKLIDQRVTHLTIATRLGRSLNAVESQLFKLRHPTKYAEKLAKARRPREKSNTSAVVIPFPEKMFHVKHGTRITLATNAGEFASKRVRQNHGASF